jgi:hypothetical protein
MSRLLAEAACPGTSFVEQKKITYEADKQFAFGGLAV